MCLRLLQYADIETAYDTPDLLGGIVGGFNIGVLEEAETHE